VSKTPLLLIILVDSAKWKNSNRPLDKSRAWEVSYRSSTLWQKLETNRQIHHNKNQWSDSFTFPKILPQTGQRALKAV